MERGTALKTGSIEFWDHFAKWYRLWVEHTSYHKKIIEALKGMISRGWKVLDVGAGNGVLSIPIHQWGCEVVALEPSIGMRNLLREEMLKRKAWGLRIDPRLWENASPEDFIDFDLVIACNTLHLTKMAFQKALEKVFQTRTKHVFLVYEIDSLFPPINHFYENYKLIFHKSYEVEDSFAYHHLGEVLGHWESLYGHPLNSEEREELKNRISVHRGHLWIKNSSQVMMCCWKKRF